MHYFIGLVIISVCVKCLNIDVYIYGTSSPPPPFFFPFLSHPGFFLVILILMYAFIVLVLFVVVVVVVVDCKADFDVDNVQRRELVNVYGV